MKISIAMTTFNGAQYLFAQLDSFLFQKRMPDELVVSDDASNDGTLGVLHDFAKRAPFKVRIYSNESNIGFTANFNRVIQLCSGDIILLSDQDDVWGANKISTIEDHFTNNPNSWLLVHDGSLVDSHLAWHGATKLRQVVAGYGSTDGLVMGALTAFRKELNRYALPIPVGISGHDGWLHLIARLLGKRYVLEADLQRLRRHSSNTSAWIASSPRKIGRLDVLRSQYGTAAAHDYSNRILINECARARVQLALTDRNRSLNPGLLGRSLAFLQKERQALLARSRLIHQGPFHRRLSAVGLLFCGGYRFFNGYRSFLRDIAR